jgi:hypothetical protein
MFNYNIYLINMVNKDIVRHIVSILALLCVWTKSLMCKDAETGIPLSECCQEIQVPCQPSGRCVIPSGRQSVYCSIRPDDVSSRPDARQSSNIRPDDVLLQSEPLHCIEKLLFQLASVRTFQQHVRTPISSRTVH